MQWNTLQKTTPIRRRRISMSAGRKQRNMTVSFVKEPPASDAARQNMISNFQAAFPGGRPVPGVRWQMLAALLAVTVIGLLVCAALGALLVALKLIVMPG